MQVRSLGREGPLENGMATPLQYSSLENPMDRGAWWATVCGITKSRTQLSMHTHAKTCKVPFNCNLIAQLVKNPPAMQETLVPFLGQEDPLEKE